MAFGLNALLYALLIANQYFRVIQCFKWPIQKVLQPQEYFSFSERIMFASEQGPVMMEDGESYIYTNTVVHTYSIANNSVSLGFAVYSAEGTHVENPVGLCQSDSSVGNIVSQNSWADQIEVVKYIGQYMGHHQMSDDLLGLHEGMYHHWAIPIKYLHRVDRRAWHTVVFMLCSLDDDYMSNKLSREIADKQTQEGALAEAERRGLKTVTITMGTVMEGEITFHNPYGFLPAEQYGLLPFMGARMVAFVLLFVFYLFQYVRHFGAVLPLHTAFVVVFLIGLVEATMWYATYQEINLSGQPNCCPFPPVVIGSLVFQVIRQTLARGLFLVVSLGYGIVRPKLMSSEWFAVYVIAVVYFVLSLVSQVGNIMRLSDPMYDSGVEAVPSATHFSLGSNVWSSAVPSLVVDVIFLSWIYLAIGSTIRILTEFQQTVKLNMYRNLVRIIGVFAVLFSVVTLVFQFSEWEWITLPMELKWVHKVMWESLNFSVLVAVCFVCIPSENSRALSYASQLPTHDPDDDEDEGEFVEASTGKYRFVSKQDIDEGGLEMTAHNGSANSNSKYSSDSGRFAGEFDNEAEFDLPEADD